jgi:hypothetical protein
VDAEDNGQGSGTNGFGVLLDNCLDFGAGCTATSPRPVVVSGDNYFWNNLDGGLEIYSLGAILLNSVNAADNGSGIIAWNNDPDAVGSVTITGGVFTADNDTFGMDVRSRGAISITVEDAWVGGNGTFGWYLDNASAPTPQPVTLSSPNPDWAFDFGYNGTYGLTIVSLGNITLTGLDAYNNGTDGAILDNARPGATGIVTISAPTFGNNGFNNNLGTGLTVKSYRAITIGKLQAGNNGWDCSINPCVHITTADGAYLDNQYPQGLGFPQAITLTDFAEFYNNGGDGLEAYSNGRIAIHNLSASDNGGFNKAQTDPGLIDPDSGWGAYVDNNVAGIPPKAILLTGSNNFNSNFQDGLWVTSLGTITINDLSANWNGGDGAYLDNQNLGAVGGITLTTSRIDGWNNFNNNGEVGLYAISYGAISAMNVNASYNTGGGAVLFTDLTISLTGRNVFNGNGDGGHNAAGLEARADGDITLNNVTANWNDGYGVYLDSCNGVAGSSCTTSGRIVLTGTNTFRGNYADGLYFQSGAGASLTKVTADGNGGDGLQGYAARNISLSCGSLTNNGGYGWWLMAWGSPNVVTLQGMFAYGNGTGNSWLQAGMLTQTRACPLL